MRKSTTTTKTRTTKAALAALLILTAISASACGSTNPNDVYYPDENADSLSQMGEREAESSQEADSEAPSGQTEQTEALPPLFTPSGEEYEQCDIRVGLQNVYTINNSDSPESVEAIVGWLRKASEDSGTADQTT